MADNSPRMNVPRLIIDLSSFAFLGILFLVAANASARVPHAGNITRAILLVAGLYAVGRWVVSKTGEGFVALAIHIVAIMLLYAFLFRTSTLLQLAIADRWNDATLISLDRAFLGSEASVWMQRFISPAMTEWMMFAYVLYIPMLPILAFLCWRASGKHGAYDYLLCFVLVNIVCYCGFLLFPVQTPMWHHPDQFSVPLSGGLFTSCGEWVRSHLHEEGGGLPSPHCAMGTVMIVMVYRHARRFFRPALLLVLTLYVSTVYCRYHYLWDALTGILTGMLIVRYSPRLVAVIERFRSECSERFVATPRGIPGCIQSKEGAP